MKQSNFPGIATAVATVLTKLPGSRFLRACARGVAVIRPGGNIHSMKRLWMNHRPIAWMGSLVLSCLLNLTALAADPLASGFLHPPDSAKPWVYWYFMDGNLTREGMTADLEAMKRAGIGGAIFLEVNIGIPRGPVKFMSPQWQELVVHGFREAVLAFPTLEGGRRIADVNEKALYHREQL